MVSNGEVMAVLKTILDPELAFNIVDLGLVYGVQVSESGEVKVTMTLTTPACPLGPELVEEIKAKVGALPGVGKEKVEAEIVWNPPWTPEKMSEQAKIELGLV